MTSMELVFTIAAGLWLLVGIVFIVRTERASRKEDKEC